MGQLHFMADVHGQQLQQARQLFFTRGERPEGLVDALIVRSWERCQRFGLSESHAIAGRESLDRLALKTEQERNRYLLLQGRPIMEHVYEQIRESGSMVILADANGLLLETVGDPDFVDRAGRIALSAGASWDENQRGTNAIGTALAEEAPTAVLGAEHFFENNAFLTCCASPIFGPDGRLIGVLDISGDYRSQQRHTLGLVRLSSLLVEKRLFECLHAGDILVCFHGRADYLGSPKEGLAAVSPDGQILAMNRAGLDILGIRQVDAVRRDFSLVFENSLATLIDRLRHKPQAIGELSVNGKVLSLQLRGQLPPASMAGRVYDEPPAERSPRPAAATPTPAITLDSLNTGDERLQAAIDRARRILGRDIPILIQGESGAGKELFAKGFHNSGPRQAGPFVALNCASIPENLIESELFGYAGGAFTGARKEGAPGKIQQAHGGTLFLDEIGDMPLNLQARLLRVLQERCVTPLGSTRAIQVDISLVCATHRRLREEVARGAFREDLYYRLNGLCVTLPALRERTDLRQLVGKLAAAEAGQSAPVQFSEGALLAIEKYAWPGNIRQLFNVIRVAIALLDNGTTLIDESHLPEELFEAAPPAPASATGSLEAIGRDAAWRTLESAGGNISAAARQLGISRNTLYRKLGKL
ncbi:sigma-54-dependent Fis family transcriptional regulator [Dechloromonas denitrificans]|uniref:sigma-54-dependent Fis family transcriptional regulator n=1 Tax=Dechloromonas denitrificans TaxID=281362 RepID=UPI001CF91EA8|nr:sigma-54-dependent Fis family transcriptional regulator [Dechloromonas denitrificans]UCV02664.1 sigma-54-dependent Fis family transcriptional regulator [Dechloromonas denitrificans]